MVSKMKLRIFRNLIRILVLVWRILVVSDLVLGLPNIELKFDNTLNITGTEAGLWETSVASMDFIPGKCNEGLNATNGGVSFKYKNFQDTLSSYLFQPSIYDFSLSIWLNIHVQPTTDCILATTNANDQFPGFSLSYECEFGGIDARLHLLAGNVIFCFGNSSHIETDKWFHFTLNWFVNESLCSIYINGKNVTTATHNGNIGINPHNTNASLLFGSWKYDLDEFKSWNRSLSEAEIRNISLECPEPTTMTTVSDAPTPEPTSSITATSTSPCTNVITGTITPGRDTVISGAPTTSVDTSTPDPPGAITASPVLDPSNPKEPDLSSGVLAGIVLGVLLLIAFIALIVFYIKKRSTKVDTNL